MTESIAAQARAAAAAGTEIVGLTPRFGADSCEGNFASYLAATAVMDRVLAYPEPFDAVIQVGYGVHGREELQELLEVPVVDIAEAAASTAMFMGHKYSVVTTLDRTVPLIEDRLKLAGLDARCPGPARIVHLEGPHLCPSAAEEDYRLAAGLTSDKPARLAARLLP